MNKNLHDRLYDLIAWKISGKATFEELQELDTLLQSKPDVKHLHDELLRYPQLNQSLTDDATDQAYAAQYVKMLYADKNEQMCSTKEDVSKKAFLKPSFFLFKMVAVAASVVLIVFLAQFFFSETTATKNPQNEIAETHPKSENGKSKLRLPDGTLVYLNTNSHLEYDGDFNKTTRNVILTGEAYFDVAHNHDKPFIVHTSKATIKVLGTKFNVKNFDNETWEATLLQGKIEMYLNNKPTEKLQLEPEQKVSISPIKKATELTKTSDFKIAVSKIKSLDNEVVETAWMTDKLAFVDEPLINIVKDLERCFGISVEFVSDKAKQQRYTGAFKNDNLKQILEILDLSNPINYKLKDNQLLIE